MDDHVQERAEDRAKDAREGCLHGSLIGLRRAWLERNEGEATRRPPLLDLLRNRSASARDCCYQLVADAAWPRQPVLVFGLVQVCSTSPLPLRLTVNSSPV